MSFFGTDLPSKRVKLPSSVKTRSSNGTDEGQPDRKSASAGKKKWLKTAAFWATGLFLAGNAVLLSLNTDKPVTGSANDSTRDLWSGTGSIALAVNGLAQLKQRPTVVLLGSSLMMHPFWTMDLQINPHIPDFFHYHGSIALERKLAEAGAPGQRVYSLAVFGEMISDGYIYVNDFLKGDKKPDVLVFGIAPRDFSDSDLPSPTATFTFKRLIGLDNFARYADLYIPKWQDKADFVATHACFFYGKRWHLQHEVERAIGRMYNVLKLPKESDALAAGAADASKNTAGFMLSGSTDERWSSSAMEYRRRYHDIATKDLSIQEGFLSRLLEVCSERHIKVVLVNMPLSAKNRTLLPADFYSRFRAKIGSIAARPGVKFVDLGDSADFTDVDFWDTAHLDHFGGHKLLDHIAKDIAVDCTSVQR